MVNGIEIFKQYFKDYNNDYVLIGGVACELALNSIALEFRPTEDFDIVIIAENSNQGFGLALKEFIKAGGYSVQKRKSNNEPTFFRFINPTNDNFPAKLELATIKPNETWQWDFAPINIGDAKSSLSAILFASDFYQFIIDNKIVINDISTLNIESLIPLKCLAYVELSKIENPTPLILANIEKHRVDVFRLADTLSTNSMNVPQSVKNIITEMLDNIASLDISSDNLILINEIKRFYEII